MTGITKKFPGVLANDNVDFELKAGEIHSLLGENGAGKTTLMNVLAGMCQPDQGTVSVGNRTVKIRSPRDALMLGIGMVYQHFTLIPNLTVLENLMLGFEGGPILKRGKAEQDLRQLSETYGLSIDPHRLIQDLSVAERQRTEILKILYHKSDIMILDEPSSVLAPAEVQNLYDTLKRLRDAGKSVILITHHLNEALAVSDRITVMRSGRKAGELSGDRLTALGHKEASDRILKLMFGKIPQTLSPAVETGNTDELLLKLDNVEVLNRKGQIGLKRISLDVRKGDIIGITGVGGEDQLLLAEVIGGQKKVSSGSLQYRGQDITRLGIARRFELGISYITADRLKEGCVTDMDLSENSTLQNFYQPPFSRFGILHRSHIRAFTADLITGFGIRAVGPEAFVATLSGGNIQKLLLARGLSGNPDLIVCNRPTQGLDTKTARFIQDRLKEESRRGAAVLLITADMEELFNCSSRIGVLFEGKLAGIMNRSDATPEKVGKLMLGIP
jgi:simple sugar transport system ATP-binding protein